MTATLAARVADLSQLPPALDRVITLVQAGDYPAASLLMRDVMDAPDAGPLTWYWGAVLLQGMRDYKGAAAMFSAVLDLDPSCYPARYNRGVTFECQGLTEAAISDYRKVLSDRPDDVMPLVNLGGCLYRIGQPAQGFAVHERTLGIDVGDDAESLAVRSAVRLLRGDFTRGFHEYEARRRMGQFKAANWAPAWGAAWDGRKTNSSVLLYHEQGIGDTIQMLRYAERACELSGHKVILCVQPALRWLTDFGLIGRTDSVRAVVTKDSEWPARPHWHAPLMSMPFLSGTTIETVPDEPYLIPPAYVASLKPPGLTVGVCWAGNKDHNNDHDRSAPRGETLRPLFDVPGVTWQSLQYGAPRVAGMRSLDAKDFAETAAVIAGCDLVITVDTSVAHLAGALGVPCWTMVPTAPEWRWGLGRGRSSSVWYRSMRIFRRRSTSEWGEMVGRMAAELQRLTQ